MKLLARHLLLAALLLRALVPLGWMPGAAQLGQAAWIICTADGGITHGTPGHDQDRQHQQPCAFAGAHALAAPVAHAFAAPLLRAAATEAAVPPAVLYVATAFAPQSPRAPPLSA
jgi:hypothetical protein